MTVSHVINDHPHVRDTTRERVVKAMSELGYRVNVAARNLRSGRTFTIGLAVAEIDRPYWGQLAARIIAEAEKHNLRVLIEQTGASRENEIDALALSRNRMYDGLILSTVGLGPSDSDILRVDYPIVILGERIFDGPVDHVAMANVDGARAAVQHLIEQGCRRIVMIDGHRGDADGGPAASSLRFAGYRDALSEAEIDYDDSLSIGIDQFSLASGRAATHELIASGTDFDGIFCVTDTVALGALRALADTGVDVPGQVKVIGFDNILEGEYSSPSLSTIDPDSGAMAKAAVELMVKRIGAGADLPPIEYVSSYRVIARESTEELGRPARSDD
jgi:DNA-binding LacI/PurR family transcriptional regulator